MRELGAELVVDYRDPAAVAAIVSGVEGSPLAGVVAIGAGSGDAAVRIAAAAGARRVALLSPPVAFTTLPRRSGPSIAFLRTMTTIGLAQLATQARARRYGIAARFVWGSSLMTNSVGPMLWEQYLPGALAEGRHVCAPEFEIVGEGLESMQHALNLLHTGVSARKLVVRL